MWKLLFSYVIPSKGRETFQWKEEDDANMSNGRSTLPPPMPPIAPTPKLRRVNSSTMSLGRTKKKMLTVSS